MAADQAIDRLTTRTGETVRGEFAPLVHRQPIRVLWGPDFSHFDRFDFGALVSQPVGHVTQSHRSGMN